MSDLPIPSRPDALDGVVFVSVALATASNEQGRAASASPPSVVAPALALQGGSQVATESPINAAQAEQHFAQASTLGTHTVQLADPIDWAGFRAAARVLLARAVPADQVHWRCGPSGAGQHDLFADSAALPAHTPTSLRQLTLPMDAPSASLQPQQLKVLQRAALHSDATRFALIFRWLQRVAQHTALRGDVLDPDWRQLEHMAKAVSREVHRMHALVRFRAVQRSGEPDWHVAWFEPEQHVLEAAAPFFARRFANQHWSILTPRACMHWNGQALANTAGVSREQAPPPDAGEALWLQYYASTFNPARLKTDTMQRQMPRKYWRNLPEAELISPLVQQARARTATMLQVSQASGAGVANAGSAPHVSLTKTKTDAGKGAVLGAREPVEGNARETANASETAPASEWPNVSSASQALRVGHAAGEA